MPSRLSFVICISGERMEINQQTTRKPAVSQTWQEAVIYVVLSLKLCYYFSITRVQAYNMKSQQELGSALSVFF